MRRQASLKRVPILFLVFSAAFAAAPNSIHAATAIIPPGSAGSSGAADDVLPLFKRSETFEDGASELHGADGGLAVSRIRAKSEIAEAFIDALLPQDTPPE